MNSVRFLELTVIIVQIDISCSILHWISDAVFEVETESPSIIQFNSCLFTCKFNSQLQIRQSK
jgi:hypothetical protein